MDRTESAIGGLPSDVHPGESLQSPLEDIEATYDRLAEEYAKQWLQSQAVEDLLQAFVTVLPESPRILDAGCGPGREVKSLRKSGIEAIGVDISAEMIRHCRKVLPPEFARVMEIQDLGFPSSVFDGVWTTGVLHFLAPVDFQRSLEEFHRVLRPNGIILIAVERGRGTYRDSNGLVRHRYKSDRLRALLESAEFRCMGVTSRKDDERDEKEWLIALAQNQEDQGGKRGNFCPFCPSKRFDLNREVGLPTVSSVVSQRGGAYLTPDLVPVIRGHSLIITEDHYPSLADADPKTRGAVNNLVGELVNRYRDIYGAELICAEHGAGSSADSGPCITHSHLHCIPNVGGWYEPFLGQLDRPSKDVSLENIGESTDGEPYLFLKKGASIGRLYPDSDFPSQVIRQGPINNGLGEEWDWRRSYATRKRLHLYLRTLRDLRPLMGEPDGRL